MIDYRRQTLLFDPGNFETVKVGVIGLGNIGSNAALTLTRLGIKKFIFWDFDTVENHNLSSQAFTVFDVGNKKTDALFKIMKGFNLDTAAELRDKFEGSEVDKVKDLDILIIAVDTMIGRRTIADQLAEKSIQPKLIIDSRVGGNQVELYNCLSVEDWKKTFVDNPSQDPCGGRFICYTSITAGAMIANQVKKFLRNEKLDTSIMFNIDAMQVIKNFEW